MHLKFLGREPQEAGLAAGVRLLVRRSKSIFPSISLTALPLSLLVVSPSHPDLSDNSDIQPEAGSLAQAKLACLTAAPPPRFGVL